jgi:two-component system, chemotaxis family, sensor kinase CheA
MAKRDDDFRKRLLSTFEIEAREHIHAISSGLIAIEKTTAAGQQQDIIEAIFREAHSLKGAARAVNLLEVEAVCQGLEGVFAAVKRQEIAVSAELCDALHQTVDSLGALVVAVEVEPTAAEKSRISALLQRLKGIPPAAEGGGRVLRGRSLSCPLLPHPKRRLRLPRRPSWCRRRRRGSPRPS